MYSHETLTVKEKEETSERDNRKRDKKHSKCERDLTCTVGLEDKVNHKLKNIGGPCKPGRKRGPPPTAN